MCIICTLVIPFIAIIISKLPSLQNKTAGRSDPSFRYTTPTETAGRRGGAGVGSGSSEDGVIGGESDVVRTQEAVGHREKIAPQRKNHVLDTFHIVLPPLSESRALHRPEAALRLSFSFSLQSCLPSQFSGGSSRSKI